MLRRVCVAVVPYRRQRLGTSRPSHQCAVIDDPSVRPGGPGEVIGAFLAAQVQACIGHEAAQRPSQEVQLARLCWVGQLAKGHANAAKCPVHGGKQGIRRRADVGAAKTDDVRLELLKHPRTDLGNPGSLGVLASFARRGGDQVRREIGSVARPKRQCARIALPVCSRVPRHRFALAPRRGLNFVVGSHKMFVRTQGRIRALPEIARDVLSPGLDIRDRAAAVPDERREPSLAVASRAAVRG